MVPQTEGSAVKDVGAGAVAATTFPLAFAAALDRRGESLEGLRRRLGDRGHAVGLSTLSYWRSGQRRPEHRTSLEALAEIEALLGLAPDDLASLLGPTRRQPPGDQAAPLGRITELEDRESVLQEVLDGLVGGLTGELTEQSVQVVVEVAAETRTIERTVVRVVWRALGDGAEHAPLVFFADEPDAVLPTITVRGGGRLDRDRSRPDLGILGRTLRLERPLRSGEEAVTEIVVELDCPDRSFEYLLVRRAQDVLVWVQFAGSPPSSVTRYWASNGDSGLEEVDLGGARSVHHRRRAVGPGHVGVRWA